MESKNSFELFSPLPAGVFERNLGLYERLQLTKPLLPDDCRRLNDYLEKNPETLFRIYPKKETGATSYDFLDMLPALRNLWLEANAGELIDLAAISTLPKLLRTLTLDTVAPFSDPTLDRPKRSVEILEGLVGLEEFTFCGRLRDLDFLKQLGRLRKLSIWRNKLKSLDGLESCTRLVKLEMSSSGAKDLNPVSSLLDLEFLDIWRSRQISSFEPIMNLPKLRQLRLMGWSITQEVPSFHGLESLRVLVIDKLPDLTRLDRIAAAPALRCLVLSGLTLSSADALEPLSGHPSLEEIRIESFDERIYSEIRARFGWKVAYCNYPADEYL